MSDELMTSTELKIYVFNLRFNIFVLINNNYIYCIMFLNIETKLKSLIVNLFKTDVAIKIKNKF